MRRDAPSARRQAQLAGGAAAAREHQRHRIHQADEQEAVRTPASRHAARSGCSRSRRAIRARPARRSARPSRIGPCASAPPNSCRGSRDRRERRRRRAAPPSTASRGSPTREGCRFPEPPERVHVRAPSLWMESAVAVCTGTKIFASFPYASAPALQSAHVVEARRRCPRPDHAHDRCSPAARPGSCGPGRSARRRDRWPPAGRRPRRAHSESPSSTLHARPSRNGTSNNAKKSACVARPGTSNGGVVASGSVTPTLISYMPACRTAGPCALNALTSRQVSMPGRRPSRRKLGPRLSICGTNSCDGLPGDRIRRHRSQHRVAPSPMSRCPPRPPG